MALTESTMMSLGNRAPDFNLPEPLTGQDLSLEQLRGVHATLVMFICNHCPYVIHVIEGIAELSADYMPRGVGFVAVNSNDVDNYPEDSPEKMSAWATQEQFLFPYLFDKSQSVAQAYGAACTPDFSCLMMSLTVFTGGEWMVLNQVMTNP